MSIPVILFATFATALGPSAPTVDEAHAEMRDGVLTVEVATSGPVAATDVRTKSNVHSVAVYLDGVRVRPDRVNLGSEIQAVIARYRPTYAKLEIPLPVGHGCGAPSLVKVGVGWVRTVIPCDGATAEVATPSATTREAGGLAGADSAKPALSRVPAPRPEPASPAEAPPRARPPVAPAPTPPAAPAAPPPANALSRSVGPTDPPTPAAAARAPAPSSPGGSLWISAVLMTLAGIAFWFWKRRGSPLLVPQIRILETASLGPKRSLILAEINGVTMVIGASEAGLALLGPASGPAVEAPPVVETPAPRERQVQPASSLDEHRRAVALRPVPAAPISATSTGDPDEDAAFAAMLAETIEDQELLHRLSVGVPGKTS